MDKDQLRKVLEALECAEETFAELRMFSSADALDPSIAIVRAELERPDADLAEQEALEVLASQRRVKA